jgi:hypothetical protein
MNVSLKRRLQGLERMLPPRPTLADETKRLALRRMSDEDLTHLESIASRQPLAAESPDEEAALRRYLTEYDVVAGDLRRRAAGGGL